MNLKPHQQLDRDFMKKHRGLILYHSVGSGKTLTAVVIAADFNGPKIIITPKSLQGNFIKEMKKFGIVDNSNYQFFTPNGFYTTFYPGMAIGSLIIVDEAHNLRNAPEDVDAMTGKISNVIIRACKEASKVLLLTATPIVNSEKDIMPLFRMVDELKCRISYYQNSPEGFPGAKMHNIFIPMESEYEGKYTKIERGLDPNSVFKSAANLTYFYNGVRRGSNLIDGISPKMEYILNLVSTIRGKIVIFSNFISTGVELLSNVLSKMYRCATIFGDVSKEMRNAIVEKYNSDQLDILFISRAGSEGLDLKETNSVILMEPGWNETMAKQTIGRAVRYKSHADPDAIVHIYKLYLIKPREMTNIAKIIQFALLRNLDGGILSVDLYLRNYSIRKQIKLDMLLADLQSESIENDKSCLV